MDQNPGAVFHRPAGIALFRRIRHDAHQPGHHFQGGRPPVGHLVEPGYRVYRVVTIPAAHHRRTVRFVAVYSRNDAETAETDFTPSLSSATHDSIDVVGGSRANQHRLSVASRFLVDLPATTYRQRNGLAHIRFCRRLLFSPFCAHRFLSGRLSDSKKVAKTNFKNGILQ